MAGMTDYHDYVKIRKNQKAFGVNQRNVDEWIQKLIQVPRTAMKSGTIRRNREQSPNNWTIEKQIKLRLPSNFQLFFCQAWQKGMKDDKNMSEHHGARVGTAEKQKKKKEIRAGEREDGEE